MLLNVTPKWNIQDDFDIIVSYSSLISLFSVLFPYIISQMSFTASILIQYWRSYVQNSSLTQNYQRTKCEIPKSHRFFQSSNKNRNSLAIFWLVFTMYVSCNIIQLHNTFYLNTLDQIELELWNIWWEHCIFSHSCGM